MLIKDYYQVLQVAPTASDPEIRKSYRRMALRFHPDTNSNQPEAAAWFIEIQEAYDVLTHPLRKAQYLQERWLAKSNGIPLTHPQPLTPYFIEEQCLQLKHWVNHLDHFRMDNKALLQQINTVLNDTTVLAIQQMNQPTLQWKVVTLLQEIVQPLIFTELPIVKTIMYRIANEQHQLISNIDNWYEQRSKSHWWDRNQIWLLAAMALLLCGFIFLLIQ